MFGEKEAAKPAVAIVDSVFFILIPMKYSISLGLIFLAFLLQAALAQSEKNNLTVSIVNAISRSNQKSVAVLGFVPSDPKMEAIGTKLADELSADLGQPAFNLQVIPRDQIKKIILDQRLESANLLDPGIGPWLAKEVEAKVMVVGNVSPGPEGSVNLSVGIYHANGKSLAGFQSAIPLTQDMKALISEGQGESGSQPVSIALNCANATAAPPPCKTAKEGYSSPKCKVCPNPKYTPEGVSERLEGRVLLMATIDETGRVTDLKPLTALPYGLTRNAIQTVQTWTFYPATGPQGEPVAIRQRIEVSFDFRRP